MPRLTTSYQNSNGKISIVQTHILFYVVNPTKVTQSTIPKKNLPKKSLGLIVAHPRSVKNAYQFLEGTSYLAHIALHPESFPIVRFFLVVHCIV